MVDELKRELLAVLREKAARAHRVALADLEHVVPDDSANAIAERVRVPQPPQRLAGELRSDLFVAAIGVTRLRVIVQPSVGPTPRDDRLPEIVEDRGEPNRQRPLGVCGGLHDGEGVLVDAEVVIARLLVEADRRLELGKNLYKHAGVARDP